MLDAMSGSRVIPEPTRAGRAAAAALRRDVAGSVSTTRLTRWLYSPDASGYRVVPDVVLVAGSTDDLSAAAAIAAAHNVPLVVRGAGTSLAGQAIGPGIMVDCFKLDRIVAIDPDRQTARVEPGVIQASLNQAAAAFGLEFGPDTATVDQATIGGMVGNNSSGSRSIVYGESVDKVRSIVAVTAGGATAAFGACHGDDLRTGIAGAQAGDLAAGLEAIRARSGGRIAAGYPQTRRCTSGYNLRELLKPEPNLARLLAGSEGTLALFTEIEVELDRRPATRVVAALSFASLRAALEANVAILETEPSAVELLDLDPLRRALNLAKYTRLAPLLNGAEPALLQVEYQGEEDAARAGLARLRALHGELGAVRTMEFTTAHEVADAWALRRAALPLLMGAPGAERPASFVEDTAVAPERLAGFVGDFQRVVAEHGARASFTGHASAGCLHVRPLLDLKSAAGVQRLAAIAEAVGELVVEYHGALSGEHGCGRSRSWFLPRLFGAEIYAEFVALKALFDPAGLLGRGTIIGGPPVTDDLRFGPDYRAEGAWRPRLSYAAEGGFDLAAEKCFGAGLCKKLTGAMCPPAAVSRDERHSTRARANAVQALVSGALPLADVTTDELRDVLGTCVACKACKSECPAGVDMAALKVEWLAERRARAGVPLFARAVADFRKMAALASSLAPLTNALAGRRVARLVTDRAGVASARPLPRFARRPLTRIAAADTDPTVVIFADCFVTYQEPEIGAALLTLLRAAGERVAVVDAGCCGRTMLSVGLVDKARRAAGHALATLHGHAVAGRTIAFVEPSCLSMVCDDWARLLPGDGRVATVAAVARLGQELVADHGEAGRLSFAGGGAALLHPHCHERALWTSAASERALACVPDLELTVLDAGCCGMSGMFGYEADHYEMSVAIAERALLPAVRGAAAGVAVLATGTSCRSQIRDLTGRRVAHPLVFLAERSLTRTGSRC
jgi:FAD/FMN-containing dehydrogenase/Fe-S oxidoreductase